MPLAAARKSESHGAPAGTWSPISAIRPRIDAALVALSPRVGNCSRWIHALRSIERRSMNGPMPDVIWVFSSAQKLGRPFQHEIAIRLDPLPRIRLLPPKIEQEHPVLVVDSDHHVDRIVAAVGRHRVVGSAIDREKPGRVIDVGFKPFVLEERPDFLGRLLLIERCKVLWRDVALDALKGSCIEFPRPQGFAGRRDRL